MIKEIPNSHYWTDLEMMINFFKETPVLDRYYIITGLQNMQSRGYSIKQPKKKPNFSSSHNRHMKNIIKKHPK
jgi:hypothetical protein